MFGIKELLVRLKTCLEKYKNDRLRQKNKKTKER